MNESLDFRSDTVTQPTEAMLEAMMSAKVGDDVFGDDPTVNALEEHAAKMFGHQAALFCPSGTMTNQIAIKVHTQPGDEVICDKLAHIYHYEGGGIAMNSGCSVRLLDGNRGRFTPQQVIGNINADDPHFPVSKMVSIENTCNKGGGAIWSKEEIDGIQKVCVEHNLKLHLDGARLFNALVESGIAAEEIGQQFDSISICLSKGLGAPVGSLLIGETHFIKKARRVRKVFGGGMRQAGYIAAAGLYALKNHVHRLKEDHQLARELSDLLNQQHWVKSVMPIETNIVVAELSKPEDQKNIIEALAREEVQCVAFGPGKIRFVTHLSLPSDALSRCAAVFKIISL